MSVEAIHNWEKVQILKGETLTGKLSIKGYASREVPNDILMLQIDFKSKCKTPDKAIDKVRDECESFILKLLDLGISANSITLADSRVNSVYNSDDFKGERSISIEIPADIATLDTITDILASSDFEYELETYYSNSDREKIKSELKKETLLNSKAQAEKVASTLDQKITGIDSIIFGSEEDYDDEDLEEKVTVEKTSKMKAFVSPRSATASIKTKKSTFAEEVKTVWIIE